MNHAGLKKIWNFVFAVFQHKSDVTNFYYLFIMAYSVV